MILLLNPLLYSGRMIPKGKRVVLPATLENVLVTEGNAEWVSRLEADTGLKKPLTAGKDGFPEENAVVEDGEAPTGSFLEQNPPAYQPELTLGRGAPGSAK